ncbi:methyltransferase domain-containing protein [Chlorobium sp. N1]|uniref:class I SAM-dependent methyltransferase n=1 Tax=Chlorobium sp. N1 TaxID=2491138 RepID=UPI00103D6F05|nr:methyltransferase domain-containing protein [Chlorobium sp. N1]TCD48753.1 methyltransferase domain-containing protein [Chlorobium sp. N1]
MTISAEENNGGPGRLMAELAREYELLETDCRIGSRQFSFTSVKDSYALLDRIDPEEFLKDEQMPYWAEIWPSALALCDFLSESVPLSGKRVVEIGAGTGLVSVVAASLGAGVVATDYSIEALRFIRCNALKNDVRLEVERLDWRNVRLEERFDTLLAADVLYERVNLLPILLSIDRLLKPDGCAYIADPRRRLAEQFLELAAENGFSVTAHAREHRGEGKPVAVNIYRLTR